MREKFFTCFCSLTSTCCVLSFAQKRHRKYLNEQDHSQMSNLGGKVGNLFGSFSAKLGDIIYFKKLQRGISDHNEQF